MRDNEKSDKRAKGIKKYHKKERKTRGLQKRTTQ